jgi:hypothetical protein
MMKGGLPLMAHRCFSAPTVGSGGYSTCRHSSARIDFTIRHLPSAHRLPASGVLIEHHIEHKFLIPAGDLQIDLVAPQLWRAWLAPGGGVDRNQESV